MPIFSCLTSSWMELCVIFSHMLQEKNIVSRILDGLPLWLGKGPYLTELRIPICKMEVRIPTLQGHWEAQSAQLQCTDLQ